jgi:hypothetical protein
MFKDLVAVAVKSLGNTLACVCDPAWNRLVKTQWQTYTEVVTFNSDIESLIRIFAMQ